MCLHNTRQKFGHSLRGPEGCLCVDAEEALSALLQTGVVSVWGPVLPQACRKTAPWGSVGAQKCAQCHRTWLIPEINLPAAWKNEGGSSVC